MNRPRSPLLVAHCHEIDPHTRLCKTAFADHDQLRLHLPAAALSRAYANRLSYSSRGDVQQATLRQNGTIERSAAPT